MAADVRFDVRLGLRYRAMTRDFDASVIQNFLPGTQGAISKTVYSTLPSLDANYRIAEGTNVYAQVSKGALAPSQSYFYTANAAAGNQANPETATAEQIGIVRQSRPTASPWTSTTSISTTT